MAHASIQAKVMLRRVVADAVEKPAESPSQSTCTADSAGKTSPAESPPRYSFAKAAHGEREIRRPPGCECAGRCRGQQDAQEQQTPLTSLHECR